MTKFLRKQIKLLLDSRDSVSYYSESTDDANYPYIVFELREVSSDTTFSNKYILEVNIWGDSTYQEIEEIADNVDKVLHNHSHIDSNMQFRIYKQGNRQQVLDENKDIYRIRILFDVTYYERS